MQTYAAYDSNRGKHLPGNITTHLTHTQHGMQDINFLITWILIGALICMLRRPDWFPILLFKKGLSHDFPDKDAALAMTARALKKMNVIRQDFVQTDNGWSCSYDFQTGHFLMTYSESDNSYLNIIFPGICDFAIDHIDAVRMTVNRANSVDTAVRFFYAVDEKHNTLILHTSVQIANTHHLNEFVRNASQAMHDLFRLRHDFIESVNDAIKASEANAVNDVEYSHAVNQRISYLLLEQSLEMSIMEDYDSSRLEASKTDDISVCEWLRTMGFLKGAKLNELKTVVGDTVQTVSTEDDILKYSMAEVLKGSDGKGSEDPTIMQIRYTPFGHADQPETPVEDADQTAEPADCETEKWNDMRCLTLTFSLIKRTEHADYYKMYYMIPVDDTLGQTHKDQSDAFKQPLYGTSVFAVNKLDEQKIAAEYNYIINDAMDKVEDGKYSELNEEQQILINLTLPEARYSIYWGHRYMRGQCYLQALLMFRRAWAAWTKKNTNAFKNDAEEKSFYDLCYWTGGCFYKLGLYQQAHYYLSQLDGLGVIDYAKLMLKCLRALNDPKTLTYINRLIREVNENIDQLKQNGAEVPEPLRAFLQYLHRENVLAYMDIDMYLAAEPLCHTMIKNNEYTDFAKEQLAIIEKKKRELINTLRVDKKNADGIPTNFTDDRPGGPGDGESDSATRSND